MKVGLSPSNFFINIIFFNDSPSEMIKKVFYFILKALFVLKILNFFVLITKFMTSQPG